MIFDNFLGNLTEKGAVGGSSGLGLVEELFSVAFEFNILTFSFFYLAHILITWWF